MSALDREAPLIISLEPDPAQKRALQEKLTAKLGDWFGRPESNAAYALQAERLDGYVAKSEGEQCGLLLLKRISLVSAEIYWLGVDPSRHRSGAGRALVEAAVKDCRSRGVRHLFVATLHPSVPYEPYQRSRLFYEALGFVHVLDEHVADPRNPLAYYLRSL